MKNTSAPAKKLRVLALMHKDLVPPEDVSGVDLEAAPWKMEYDVMRTLSALGHEVQPVPVDNDLGVIRNAHGEFKPHIAFNLLEGFDEVASYDHNVVAYLELLKLPYTGCNSKGLLLAREKSISKKLLAYHHIPVPAFAIFPRGRKVRPSKRLVFPLFVKSLTLDASIGISQASVVENQEKLKERVEFIHEKTGTDALVESYIEGRELYVGVMGNLQLKVLPVWELLFAKMPEETRNIATERLKWSLKYQKKHGIESAEARDLPEGAAQRIQTLCKRVYRTLLLSGCARVDLRMTDAGRAYVIEANPNPQLSHDEDFAQSAKKAGIGYETLIQRLLVLGLKWQPDRLG